MSPQEKIGLFMLIVWLVGVFVGWAVNDLAAGVWNDPPPERKSKP